MRTNSGVIFYTDYLQPYIVAVLQEFVQWKRTLIHFLL